MSKFDQFRKEYSATYSSVITKKEKSEGVIYIEDILDKNFWEKIATSHLVKLYSEGGRDFTGKSKLLNICNKNNIIAIDSDFDYICTCHRQDSKLFWQKKDYILQTYAYSRENLIYTANYLFETLKEKFKLYLDNHQNQIIDIMTGLSNVLYPIYQKYLFLKNERINLPFTWENEIGLNMDTDLLNQIVRLDFVNYSTKIQLLDEKLTPLISDPQKYSLFCSELASKGFDKSTTLYFIRGHDIEEKIVLPIMHQLIENRKRREKEYVEQHFSENEQSERVKSLFNEFAKCGDTLKHYFIDVYISTAKQNDFFIRKILDDYNVILTR